MNEFHTLNGTCSTLIPQGPGYENVSLANQVCTTVGSLPGMTIVDGNRFASLSYGYSYSDLSLLKCNVPQNYGIICAFGVGSLALPLITVQYNTSSMFSSAVALFKRGSLSPKRRQAGQEPLHIQIKLQGRFRKGHNFQRRIYLAAHSIHRTGV